MPVEMRDEVKFLDYSSKKEVVLIGETQKSLRVWMQIRNFSENSDVTKAIRLDARDLELMASKFEALAKTLRGREVEDT